MNRKIFQLLLIALVAINFSTVSFCAEITKKFEKTFKIRTAGQISVKADEGFIKVDSWEKSEVQLVWTKTVRARTKNQAEKLMDLAEVRINYVGNRLYVKVVKPNERRSFSFWDLLDPDTWRSNYRTPIVDFELTVPQEINLSLSADEGNVDVESIQGDLDIDVDEGDIELRDIEFEDLELSTDEGEIRASNINNAEGSIAIEVDEGDIFFDDVNSRRLRVECDEGDATFKNLICRFCNISTDEGDIELDIKLKQDDRYQISTDEGNVLFYLPPHPDVRFDLETSDGGIDTDFAVKVKRDDDWEQCRDSLGEGTALLKAYTDEGIIYLKKH